MQISWHRWCGNQFVSH